MVGDLLITTGNTASNTDTLTFLLPVVIGGAIGIAGSLVTTLVAHPLQVRRERLAHALQMERERKAHIRHLQEEKINRLRQVYAKVLYAANMLQKALAEMQFVMGETIEKRNERISTYLTGAFSDWEKARVDLMLEEPDERVIETFNAVYDAFIDYTQGEQVNTQLPNTVSILEFQAYKQKANDEVDKLKMLLSSRLRPGVLNPDSLVD